MKNYFQGKKRIIIYTLFILLGVFLAIAVFSAIKYSEISAENKIRESVKNDYIIKIKNAEKIRLAKKEIFDSIKTEAKSFYIYDLENNSEIFSKNKNKRFGIASLTKIATSDIFLESIKNTGKEKVIILKKNLAKSGDNGLKWGEKFLGKELVKFMMAVSSNDAASALTNNTGEVIFIEKMNALAENLGMDSTLFFSESGLDISQNILGSYSTAENISKLVKYFYKKYPEISADFSQAENKICSEKLCHNIENTNTLFFEKCTEFSLNSVTDLGDKNSPWEKNRECIKKEKYPHKILFSKTGYTKKSGGSIAMISEISGKKILIIVLNSGKNSRFTDVENISKAVEKYLKIKK